MRKRKNDKEEEGEKVKEDVTVEKDTQESEKETTEEQQ